MTREFSGFLELLHAHGALSSNPELSRRFDDISQKFFALTPGNPFREGDGQSAASSTAGRDKAPAPHHRRRLTMGTISSASSDNFMTMPTAAQPRPNAQGMANSFASSGSAFYPPDTLSYEVITQPTPENASFPSYTPDPQAPSGWVEQPPVTAQLSAQALVPQIPTPSSYIAPDGSFSRRLQLSMLRRMLMLATMTNPSPDAFGAVFGLSLLFESREAIILRLTEQVQALEQADMTGWSGTPSRPGGMGSFSHNVRFDKRAQMEYPGFDGVFLDSDEVERHLEQLGVRIPANAEYVSAELYPDQFASAEETGTVAVSAPPGGQGSMQMQGSGMAQAQGGAVATMFSDRSASGAADTPMDAYLCPPIDRKSVV